MIQNIENKCLSLTFSDEINNVMEIRNKATEDNYIKVVPENPIFSLWCMKKENGKKKKFVPSKPVEFNKVCSEGACRLELGYKGLIGEDDELKADIKLTAEIKEDCIIRWNIEIKNEDEAYDVVEVLFPHVRGIYLGDSWNDDTVIYPHHAGEKTLNPIVEYTGERHMNFWRANTKLEDKVYYREINYCGLASMMWMYYYDKDNGFYISSNDGDFFVTGMRVETGGIQDPWMGFGIRKYVKVKSGETWKSNPYSMAVNCEDWHWGAKTYRKWIEPYLLFDNNPSLLKDEYVLNQCYNFKKDGRLHNKFDKIPELFDKGKEYGMRHMFIASWNRKGFDCNYPEYYPDMDLGTSMDLYNGCKYVNENGGFVTFYINARIFDMDSDFFPTLGQAMAIKDENGKLENEKYGPVEFAVMCPSDKGWQKHLIDTACWMVKSYDATGIYLDQLGSAEPFPCYDEEHSHENTGEFNKGYLHIIKTLREKLGEMNPDTFLMIENCGDIYGSYIWGNLTWNGDPYDEHYNVFKYTFPEFVQVNMVNPRMGLTGEARVRRFYMDMERALLLGSVLWMGMTYKFGEDDEELRLFAEKAIKLRGKLNTLIAGGRYTDDEGIVYASRGINISRWAVEDGSNLFIVGNLDMLSGSRLEIKLPERPGSISSEDIDGNCIDLKYSVNGNSLKINLPESRISYILIK